MPDRHHPIGPSSADRCLNCPGSVLLNEGKDSAGDPAREGTCCHALLEFFLVAGVEPEALVGKEIIPEKYVDGSPILVTEEMVGAVRYFKDTVHGFLLEEGISQSSSQVEQHMIHPLIPNEMFGGTADFYAFGKGILVIADLKFGYRAVDPASLQLSAYALLTLATRSGEFDEPIREIVQIVVQPRRPDGKTFGIHRMPVDNLTPVWEKVWHTSQVCEAYKETPREQLPLEILSVGSHCDYCPSKVECPQMLGTMEEVVTAYEQGMVNREDGRTDEQFLSYWLQKKEAIEAFLNAVYKKALASASNGVEIPGKKLTPVFGHRKWKADFTSKSVQAQVKHLQRVFGIPAAEARKEPDIRSVAQIEKWLKDNGVWAGNAALQRKFHALFERGVSSCKLVDKTSSDPAVTPEMVTQLEQIALEYDSGER